MNQDFVIRLDVSEVKEAFKLFEGSGCDDHGGWRGLGYSKNAEIGKELASEDH